VNICFDARTAQDHFTGIGRYAVNLARTLGPCLLPSEKLVVLRDSGSPSRLDLSPVAGDRVRIMDFPVSPFSLRQQWTLPRLLRGLGPSVYHSPYYLMPFLPGVPTVVTIHDLVPLRYPQYFTPLGRLLFSATIRLAVRAARAIIADSEATALDIKQFLAVEPMFVIPLAAAFSPQSVENVAAARARCRLPERYVLYVGSNKPHKNLVRLVAAWARLQPQALQLVIAGPWDRRYREARLHAEKLGLGDAVRFLGAVEEADLPALYSGATLFVFPSEYEGFGLPVLEAMACGVPVACAAVGNLPELAGQAALLFDPWSVDAIAQAIRELLNDPDRRAELTRLGLERAAQFTWEETARRTVSVYRQVAV